MKFVCKIENLDFLALLSLKLLNFYVRFYEIVSQQFY